MNSTTALDRIKDETEGPEIRAIYTHREDADGLVCALIARQYFGDEVPIIALDYTELHRIIDTPCLVLDLNLPADHPLIAPRLAGYGDEPAALIDDEGELVEPGPAAELIGHDGEARPVAPVVIIDHHRASWYPSQAPPEGSYVHSEFGPGLSLLWHPERCAAEIAYDALADFFLLGDARYPAAEHLKQWVRVARAADFFLEEDPYFSRGRAFSALVRMAGFEQMLEMLFPPEEVTAPVPHAAFQLGAAISDGENLRADAIAQQTLHEARDFRFALCAGGSVSVVAAELLKTYGTDKPIVLCILQTLGSPIGPEDSIRDRAVSFGVRGPGALELARRFGGGGHPEAAGFQLPGLTMTAHLAGLGYKLEQELARRN